MLDHPHDRLVDVQPAETGYTGIGMVLPFNVPSSVEKRVYAIKFSGQKNTCIFIKMHGDTLHLLCSGITQSPGCGALLPLADPGFVQPEGVHQISLGGFQKHQVGRYVKSEVGGGPLCSCRREPAITIDIPPQKMPLKGVRYFGPTQMDCLVDANSMTDQIGSYLWRPDIKPGERVLSIIVVEYRMSTVHAGSKFCEMPPVLPCESNGKATLDGDGAICGDEPEPIRFCLSVYLSKETAIASIAGLCFGLRSSRDVSSLQKPTDRWRGNAKQLGQLLARLSCNIPVANIFDLCVSKLFHGCILTQLETSNNLRKRLCQDFVLFRERRQTYAKRALHTSYITRFLHLTTDPSGQLAWDHPYERT